MEKSEFIATLRLQLTGELSDAEINTHIAYYERYILEDMKNGKTEEEVIESLGDPRLIAKTLVETSANAFEREESEYTSQTQQSYERADEGFGSSQTEEPHKRSSSGSWFGLDLSKWYAKVIAVLVAVGIVILLISFFTILFPFLLILLAIMLVLSLIRSNRR
ncbi:MAG: DUF1700 domain-containing protein [Lachnospiraceae bacterium]